jgi:hypothetical protein
MMMSEKTLENGTCPRCGSTGKFENIQQKVYTPPMTKRKLFARIERCLDCNEAFGTVSKYQSHKEFENDM